MANFAITIDAPVQYASEPGFFHRYDSHELVRSLNAVTDGISNQALWTDSFHTTIMLRPEQLNSSFLNQLGQLNYIIRLSAFTANPANLSSVHLFEANFMQNANNPFIHHTPLSPSFPTLFQNSPEQVPGLTAIDNFSNNSGSVTGAPQAVPREFPGVSSSDMKVICWTTNPLPWNMPLYLRWWVNGAPAGHLTLYDFYIGQFCVRCGPSTVELFRDISAQANRSAWQNVARCEIFTFGQSDSTQQFGLTTHNDLSPSWGHLRELLWLPYRRNFIYLRSNYGQSAVVRANTFTRTNGLSGSQADWGIVESRNLVVAGLTPGPSFFQIQKVKFADGPGQFNLPPFLLDYAPAAAPNSRWLVDEYDTPQGSTLSHTTPATPPGYSFQPPGPDGCSQQLSDPATDQSRTYGSTYTLSPGTDPTNGALKTYSPMLYGVEARVGQATTSWPVTALSFTDVSLARPSARIKRAEIIADVSMPGRFNAEVEDLGTAAAPPSLASYYSRSDFPMTFSDQNGQPLTPANWTTLWAGIADPMEARELRLDQAAPREVRLVGSDFWKWLNEAPMRDNRDWTGFGHITVIQNVLQQAGVSIANWDGPAPGAIVSKTLPNGQVVDTFVPDTAGQDDPLGGLGDQAFLDPTTGLAGSGEPNQGQPVKPLWRPLVAPPDSYGSFIKRIAEMWSGWDYGFHPDGSFYYHRWDYYTASEMVFHKNQTLAAPRYFRASVAYEPLFPDANVVVSVAPTSSGSLRYSPFFVDFASLRTQSAVNFIGKEKAILFALPGWLSCDAQIKATRAVFERARRRRYRVHFRGTYVPTLKLGHCHQLEGISGTWRLQSVKASYERQGWDTAEYISELVEAGHN